MLDPTVCHFFLALKLTPASVSVFHVAPRGVSLVT